MTAKTGKPAVKAKGAQALAPATGYKNSTVAVAVAADCSNADVAAAVARKLTRPEVSAAGVIENWQKDTHDVNALADELGKQVEAVNGGDLRRAEGLLIAQAHVLDNIFTHLARRATNQQYLKQWETYMRMAMKAQNQCRMTLETLATIKNPPVVFAKQANINNGGQQQVNNGGTGGATPEDESSTREGAHAQETETEQSRLLETPYGERMDVGTKGEAGRANSRMETVGAIKRPQDRGR